MNTKSSTKCCVGCRCFSSGRSPPKVSNFRYQGFRSTSAITPAIPKAETTRNQLKIQPHPKWNSSVQLATKPLVTLPGTKKTLEDLRLVQPFQANPVPESTYKPFRPILSKDRTSVIDRRNRKTLQELANKEMSIKENDAKDFKPNPFRAKILPASTYKPFRPVLSKDRQTVKRRTAVMKKPMVLESPDGNDAMESTSGNVEQHSEVDQMPAGKIREPIKNNISIAAEEGNNGEEEPDNQPVDVESNEVLLDEEEMVPGENVDPDLEESQTIDENQEYSEEPAEITEESEIIEEQETADEEPDNGDEVLLNENVDTSPMPEI